MKKTLGVLCFTGLASLLTSALAQQVSGPNGGLRWDYPESERSRVEFFRIYGDTGAGPVEIGTSEETSARFDNMNVENGVQYEFTVTAVNQTLGLESAPSNPASCLYVESLSAPSGTSCVVNLTINIGAQ